MLMQFGNRLRASAIGMSRQRQRDVALPIGQSACVRPDELSGEPGNRLLSHLRLLIDEEAALSEAAAESTIVGTDDVERYGPFDPEACSWVLIRWYQAGLIGVRRYIPGSDASDELAEADGYLALERFEKWRTDEPELHLFATSRGTAEADDVWLGVLRDG
jgi:hypothetical protein